MKITCSKRNYGGAFDIDPPEYDEPDKADEVIEYIEVSLDADIIIAEDGSWEYEDEEYPWACPDARSTDWRSEEYPDVYLDDCIGVVEKVDELMEDKLPSEPGKYHVSGDARLCYSIDDVNLFREFEGVDEDHGPVYDETIDTDDSDIYYVASESSLENFECVPSSSVTSSTKINASRLKYENPSPVTPTPFGKWTAPKRYDMHTTVEYGRQQYSVYYTEIDTSQEADPDEMLRDFRAQVSVIRPYDDADYFSAIIRDGFIRYAKNGKSPSRRDEYANPVEMGVENEEWCEFVIEGAIMELEALNASIDPVMVHW